MKARRQMGVAAFGTILCGLLCTSACAQTVEPTVATERYAKLVERYQLQVPLWRLLHAVARRLPNDDGALARARLRGLVPQIRVGGRVRKGNNFLQVQADDSGRLNLSSDEQLTLDVELRFSLDRLLYDQAEPALRRERAERNERRRKDRERIIELYSEWVHLNAARDHLGEVPLQHHAHINLVAARLNLFTEGAFFRMLRSSRAAHHE